MSTLRNLKDGLLDGLTCPFTALSEIINMYRDPEYVNNKYPTPDAERTDIQAIAGDFLAVGNDIRKVNGNYDSKEQIL